MNCAGSMISCDVLSLSRKKIGAHVIAQKTKRNMIQIPCAGRKIILPRQNTPPLSPLLQTRQRFFRQRNHKTTPYKIIYRNYSINYDKLQSHGKLNRIFRKINEIPCKTQIAIQANLLYNGNMHKILNEFYANKQ